MIAAYEFTKGLLLVFVAIGLLRLLHRDLQQVAMHWAHVLRLDLQNRFVAALLARANLVNPTQISQLSALSFFLGALHLTQGVGLFMAKRWAELLTVVATAAFIPLEIYEITRHVGPVRVTVLLANVALVVYLIVVLRGKHRAAPVVVPAAVPPVAGDGRG